MKELIQQELNKALKNQQKVEVSVLRGLLAEIQNKEKERQYQEKKEVELTNDDILNIAFSQLKKREESIESFEKGNRLDLIEKEQAEINVLKKYLPKPLSEQELIEIIDQAIKKTQASQIQDIKNVMAEVMPQVKQRARGDQIGKLVKERLCL